MVLRLGPVEEFQRLSALAIQVAALALELSQTLSSRAQPRLHLGGVPGDLLEACAGGLDGGCQMLQVALEGAALPLFCLDLCLDLGEVRAMALEEGLAAAHRALRHGHPRF